MIVGQFRALFLSLKMDDCPSVVVFWGALYSEASTLGPYCLYGFSERNAHFVAAELAGSVLDELRMAGCQTLPDSLLIEPKSVGENWPEAKAAILDVLNENLDELLPALKLEQGILERSVLDKLHSQMIPQRGRKTCSWDALDEEHNCYIYNEILKRTLRKNIRAEVNKHQGWRKISSLNGIKAAAVRYAAAYDLPRIEPRKRGRPEKES